MQNPPKIIPAALAKSESELKLQLDKLVGLSTDLHIDYSDGKLVSGTTLDWQELLDLPELYHQNLLEIHIMAQDPSPLAEEFLSRGFNAVVIQAEALIPKDRPRLEQLAQTGPIGLALKPQTRIETIEKSLPFVAQVTVMTVEPGGQGRAFDPKALEKVANLRAIGFNKTIDVDGSVNLSTIDQILQYDVDRLVVGSALTRAKEPGKVYQKLQEQISKITISKET